MKSYKSKGTRFHCKSKMIENTYFHAVRYANILKESPFLSYRKFTNMRKISRHILSITMFPGNYIKIFMAEVEKNYGIKTFLACLNVLVVVLHGQNCIVNVNCLYKAILKTDMALKPNLLQGDFSREDSLQARQLQPGLHCPGEWPIHHAGPCSSCQA